MDFVFKAFFLQFLIFGMLVHVVRPQTGGTDCRGKDYLCLDDVRFQLCVDYGDGKPTTVDDEVQLCPQGTFCSNSGRLECDSFVPPSTTAEPHVDVDESETVQPEEVVEEVALPTEPAEAEQDPSAGPPTESTTSDDGTNVDGVESVDEESAPGEPAVESSSSPADESPAAPTVVPSEAPELSEASDANTTVQNESAPDSSVATEGAAEQTTEEPLESTSASEAESEDVANPTTAEPSTAEPTSQSSNGEAAEGPTDASAVSAPEESNPAEEAATTPSEVSTVLDETSPDTTTTEEESVQTESPTGEVTEHPSSSVVVEGNETTVNPESASEGTSSSDPEGSEHLTTVASEGEPITEEDEAEESSSAGATEAVTGDDSQSEHTTQGVSTSEANTDEVSTASGEPEAETEAPQTSSSSAPEASETTQSTGAPVTESVEPEVPETSSVSSEPSETTASVTVTSDPVMTSSTATESSAAEPATNESSSDEGETSESSSSQDSTEAPESGTESNEISTATPGDATSPAPFVCQTAGRFAHPTDCHKYYICFWLPFGLYSLEQNCLVGFAYNPTLERCTADQSVCFPGQFTCAGPGRFPDPADPTRYFWCVWNMFGGYLQYNLQCPLGQVFNPFRGRCAFVIAGRSLSAEPLDGEEASLAEESPEEPEGTQADQPTEPAQPVEPVTPSEPTQPKLKVKFQCLEEGTFADPNNCSRYFVCTLKKLNKFKKSKLKCVTGERFDALVGACVPDVDALCG